MAQGQIKYIEVRNHLSKRIATMSPGDRLPSEPVLCDEYGVSRITLRKAVDDLVLDGYLRREQGRGTFVSEPKFTQQVRESFSEQVTGFFRQQTALDRLVTTSVLTNDVVRNAEAALALELNAAEELIHLERLRYVNGALHQHVDTFLPAARFPGVLAQDFSTGSLYDYLEKAYGIVLSRNELLVRVEAPDNRVAKLLHMKPGTPILAIDSTVWGTQPTPVAFGTARHTPGNSEISFSLSNLG